MKNICLYDYYESVNPSYPYWDFDPFCLDSFNLCECEGHFRVAKGDLPILLMLCRIRQLSSDHKEQFAVGWRGRAVPNTESISLPIAIFPFNFNICSSNTRVVYDHKHST